MKEHYVSYEQSQALKRLGFDWKCDHYYESKNRLYESTIYTQTFRVSEYWHNFNEDDQDRHRQPFNPYYSAPRLDRAAAWLREKGMFLMVDPRYYQGDAVKDVKWCFIVQSLDDISGQYRSECCGRLFDSYESALSAGIDKAFELLTDNQNGK